MMKRQYFLIIIMVFALISSNANAQNDNTINVVTTAVPFLRISTDASSGGMGDVGLATTLDANAVFWNAAKIPFASSKSSLAVNYSPWLKDWVNDMYIASVMGYHQLMGDQAIYGSLRYFNLGDLQFTDNAGNHLQSFNPREFGIDLGYARKLSEKMGLSLGLKYIYSNLANDGAGGSDYRIGNAVAADLGFYYDAKKATGNGWGFGAALTNLGSKISYTTDASQKDYLPANLGLGTSYSILLNEQNKINLGLDVNKLLVPTPPAASGNMAQDSANLYSYRNKSVVGSWFSSFGDAPAGFSEELKEFQISAGAEYWYNDQFAIRAGYFYEDKSKGNRKYFTTGASVRYNTVSLNFSYLIPTANSVNKNPLANTLRFGLLFDFKN